MTRNPQRLWLSIQDLNKIMPVNRPAWMVVVVGRYGAPLLVEKLFTTDGCWEKESVFFKLLAPGRMTMIQDMASY